MKIYREYFCGFRDNNMLLLSLDLDDGFLVDIETLRLMTLFFVVHQFSKSRVYRSMWDKLYYYCDGGDFYLSNVKIANHVGFVGADHWFAPYKGYIFVAFDVNSDHPAILAVLDPSDYHLICSTSKGYGYYGTNELAHLIISMPEVNWLA